MTDPIDYTQSDNARDAASRGVPKINRCYKVTFSSATAKKVILPIDCKVVSIENQTDKDLYFYPLHSDGTNHDTSLDLFTAGTSSKIDTVKTTKTYPLAQQKEFNAFSFKSTTTAASGYVYIRVGEGIPNGPDNTGLGAGLEVAELGTIS